MWMGGSGRSRHLHLLFLLGEVLELDEVDGLRLEEHVVRAVGVARLLSLIKHRFFHSINY